jgi:hypothetical protein
MPRERRPCAFGRGRSRLHELMTGDGERYGPYDGGLRWRLAGIHSPINQEGRFMREGPWANALAAALCLLSASSASAQEPTPAPVERVVVAATKGDISSWFRAESQRFVVYSNAREEDVAGLLDNLEKLDHVLASIPAHPAGSSRNRS